MEKCTTPSPSRSEQDLCSDCTESLMGTGQPITKTMTSLKLVMLTVICRQVYIIYTYISHEMTILP